MAVIHKVGDSWMRQVCDPCWWGTHTRCTREACDCVDCAKARGENVTREMTKPTPAEVEVVRRAAMSPPPNATSWLRGEVRPIVVEGGPPASISYLHSIAARGLADNYIHTQVEVQVTGSDRMREPALRDVVSVTLHYRER